MHYEHNIVPYPIARGLQALAQFLDAMKNEERWDLLTSYPGQMQLLELSFPEMVVVLVFRRSVLAPDMVSAMGRIMERKVPG